MRICLTVFSRWSAYWVLIIIYQRHRLWRCLSLYTIRNSHLRLQSARPWSRSEKGCNCIHLSRRHRNWEVYWWKAKIEGRIYGDVFCVIAITRKFVQETWDFWKLQVISSRCLTHPSPEWRALSLWQTECGRLEEIERGNETKESQEERMRLPESHDTRGERPTPQEQETAHGHLQLSVSWSLLSKKRLVTREIELWWFTRARTIDPVNIRSVKELMMLMFKIYSLCMCLKSIARTAYSVCKFQFRIRSISKKYLITVLSASNFKNHLPFSRRWQISLYISLVPDS